MIISCVFPLVAVAVFGRASSSIARRTRPALALWLLSLGGLALAALGVVDVGVVAAGGLGQLRPVAVHEGWSPRVMTTVSPFPTWAGALAVLVLVALAFRALRVLRRDGGRLIRAWASSHAAPRGLVVLDIPTPTAYAVPGWPGRVVVSRSLLRMLDGPGRRALLAHEEAHLRDRHDLHMLAGSLAAALNPCLRRVPAAVGVACERRADEVAARVVGDRRTVAAAILRAVHLPQAAEMLFAAGAADISGRVDDLLHPRRRDRLPAVLPTLLILASAASLWWLARDLDALLDAAAAVRAHR